jgi:hypothetical protein
VRQFFLRMDRTFMWKQCDDTSTSTRGGFLCLYAEYASLVKGNKTSATDSTQKLQWGTAYYLFKTADFGTNVTGFAWGGDDYSPDFLPPPTDLNVRTSDREAVVEWAPPDMLPFQGEKQANCELH